MKLIEKIDYLKKNDIMKKIFCLLFLSLFLVSCNNKEEPIKEDSNQEAIIENEKEEVTLISLELSGYKSEFKNGEEFSIGDLVVMGIYSDSSKKEITDYEIDSSKFNKDIAGSYQIVVKKSGISLSYNVTVIKSGEMDLPLV